MGSGFGFGSLLVGACRVGFRLGLISVYARSGNCQHRCTLGSAQSAPTQPPCPPQQSRWPQGRGGTASGRIGSRHGAQGQAPRGQRKAESNLRLGQTFEAQKIRIRLLPESNTNISHKLPHIGPNSSKKNTNNCMCVGPPAHWIPRCLEIRQNAPNAGPSYKKGCCRFALIAYQVSSLHSVPLFRPLT